jgi:hypothetical protein
MATNCDDSWDWCREYIYRLFEIPGYWRIPAHRYRGVSKFWTHLKKYYVSLTSAHAQHSEPQVPGVLPAMNRASMCWQVFTFFYEQHVIVQPYLCLCLL